MPLTAARLTKSKNLGAIKRYLMPVSTTIYAGSMVMLNSAGLAVPAAAAAGNKGVMGVALKTVVSPAAGSTYVELQQGWFRFAGTTLAQASVGSLCFAEDDQTVDETQGANEPIAGILMEIESASIGWVDIGPELLT